MIRGGVDRAQGDHLPCGRRLTLCWLQTCGSQTESYEPVMASHTVLIANSTHLCVDRLHLCVENVFLGSNIRPMHALICFSFAFENSPSKLSLATKAKIETHSPIREQLQIAGNHNLFSKFSGGMPLVLHCHTSHSVPGRFSQSLKRLATLNTLHQTEQYTCSDNISYNMIILIQYLNWRREKPI